MGSKGGKPKRKIPLKLSPPPSLPVQLPKPPPPLQTTPIENFNYSFNGPNSSFRPIQTNNSNYSFNKPTQSAAVSAAQPTNNHEFSYNRQPAFQYDPPNCIVFKLQSPSFDYYSPNYKENNLVHTYAYNKPSPTENDMEEIEYVPLYYEYPVYRRHLKPRCACSRPSNCMVVCSNFKPIRRVYRVKPTATIED